MKDDLTRQVQGDMNLLRSTIRVLDSMPGRLDDHEEGHLRAFTGMLEEMVSGKRTKLTEKQRGYLKGVHDRIAPRVQHLTANDREGERIAVVPDVLRVLPKKPPTRIAR
jgi:hypothetical protein